MHIANRCKFIARNITTDFRNFVLSPLYKHRKVGKDTLIDSSAQILGWRWITIGSNSVIGEGCWLNVNKYEGTKAQIVIGNNCFIGRRTVISPGSLIEFSDYSLLGYGCSFLGADHIYSDPFIPYVATGATTSSEMRIGANCWFGHSVTILGGITLGFGSVFASTSLIRKDVPPFSLVVGNPGRVIKRYDMARRQWIEIEKLGGAEPEIPSETEYMAQLSRNALNLNMPRKASGRSQGHSI